MADLETPRSALLAAAAKRYVEERYSRAGKRATAVDVARYATRWSVDGWQAVARLAGLDTPTLDVMQKALDIIGGDARKTRDLAAQ